MLAALLLETERGTRNGTCGACAVAWGTYPQQRSVTRGPGSAAGASLPGRASPWGATAVWWVLELGDVAEGMRWLSSGAELLQPSGGVSRRISSSSCFFATSEHIPFPSPVPGGIASESLTFTPLEDMIFLKWEEPVEPNGLITQYEVCPGCGTRGDPWGCGRVPLEGCSGEDLGQLLALGCGGLKVAAALLLPPSPLFGARTHAAWSSSQVLSLLRTLLTGVTQQQLF